MANILNCNPINGNVITETSARIVFFGTNDSIANIYFNARKNDFEDVARSNDFTHLVVNGVSFDKSYSKSFYEALWYQFFSDNPNLIEKIKSYDGYYDGLPEKAYNSTARVFRMLKSFGMNGLYSNIKPFLSELKERSPKQNTPVSEGEYNGENAEKKQLNASDIFNNMDLMVKRVVNKYYGKIDKSEIINCEELKPLNDKITLKRLITVRCDEKEGNCSKAYINNMITSIRNQYTNYDDSQNDNKIVLE